MEARGKEEEREIDLLSFLRYLPEWLRLWIVALVHYKVR